MVPPRARLPSTPSARVALALSVLVLVALGPFVAEITAQSASRYTLAAAIVDDGTIRLDDHRDELSGEDFVERDGHVYSDKVPGQAVIAVPAYAVARLVGADPAHGRFRGDLGAWWITLWTSVLPAAALCALMYRHAARAFPEQAVQAALALSFGTLLLVFSTQMYGHALSALLGFAAWTVAQRQPLGRRDALVCGALVGAAASVELTLVVVGLLVLALWLRRGALGRVGWFVLGGLPFAALLLGYQWAAYGSPLRTSYSLKDSFDSPTIVGVPDPSIALQALVGSRGILVLTPVVLLGLVGCVLLLGDRPPQRRAALAALGLFAFFVFLQGGWPNPWGGEMPGPRYFVPALPFLAVPLARAWARWPLVGTVAAIVGGGIMGLGVLTVHLVPMGGGVVSTYVSSLDRFGVTPTIYTLAIGPLGWAVYGTTVLLAIMHLRTTVQAQRAAPPQPSQVPA